MNLGCGARIQDAGDYVKAGPERQLRSCRTPRLDRAGMAKAGRAMAARSSKCSRGSTMGAVARYTARLNSTPVGGGMRRSRTSARTESGTQVSIGRS